MIYKSLRNKVVLKLCKAKALYCTALIEKAKDHNISLWNHLNKLINRSSSRKEIKEIHLNGTVITDKGCFIKRYRNLLTFTA